MLDLLFVTGQQNTFNLNLLASQLTDKHQIKTMRKTVLLYIYIFTSIYSLYMVFAIRIINQCIAMMDLLWFIDRHARTQHNIRTHLTRGLTVT